MVSAFYVGEAAKFGVTIVLFIVVLATMKRMLVPGALFGALRRDVPGVLAWVLAARDAAEWMKELARVED